MQFSLRVSLAVCLSACLSASLSLCLSVSRSVSLCLFLQERLSVCITHFLIFFFCLSFSQRLATSTCRRQEEEWEGRREAKNLGINDGGYLDVTDRWQCCNCVKRCYFILGRATLPSCAFKYKLDAKLQVLQTCDLLTPLIVQRVRHSTLNTN